MSPPLPKNFEILSFYADFFFTQLGAMANFCVWAALIKFSVRTPRVDPVGAPRRWTPSAASARRAGRAPPAHSHQPQLHPFQVKKA